MSIFTYRDLLELLPTLSEAQLNQPAQTVTDLFTAPLITISELWVTEEDQINPSGEGCEPISAYKDEPDFEVYKDEPVIYPKGTVLLVGTYDNPDREEREQEFVGAIREALKNHDKRNSHIIRIETIQ